MQDTTGAGDAFNGTFACAIAEGVDAVEAVRFGCACGALSIMKVGAAPAMPTRAEIEGFMARADSAYSAANEIKG